VAAAAGCSTATVSKALNGIPVSEANLKRVFAAVDELGYVPNLAARSMRHEKSMTIGMAVNFEGHPRMELLAVFQTLIGQLEALGYSVLLSIVWSEGVEVDSLLRRFIAHRVDGLIYWNAKPSSSLLLYERAKVPVIAFGFRSADCVDVPLVTVDVGAALATVIKRLKSLGHKVVAELAVERHLFLNKLSPTPRGIRWRDLRVGYDIEDVRALVDRELTGPDAPTAVFASPPTAQQVLAVCEERNIRVPEDLSLIALTDSDDFALMRTSLSSIRTDFELLGHAAASALVDALAGKPVEDVILENAAHYIERASTGPAPQRNPSGRSRK
jgi:LacI family transcriptional regulator